MWTVSSLFIAIYLLVATHAATHTAKFAQPVNWYDNISCSFIPDLYLSVLLFFLFLFTFVYRHGFGYYEYLPDSYDSASSTKHPVIIHLHGAGEVITKTKNKEKKKTRTKAKKKKRQKLVNNKK